MIHPNLYIIAGCNGAGKTTASMSVLPEVLACEEFVNADEIAKGLSPFHPEEMAIEAGKLMLNRIDTLLSRRQSFAIETTLATRSYLFLVRRAKAAGYTVTLLFFWLPSPEMAEQRVASRWHQEAIIFLKRLSIAVIGLDLITFSIFSPMRWTDGRFMIIVNR